MKEIEKLKQKTQSRVSRQEYAYAYISLRTWASCMHTDASSMHAHAKTKTQKNKAET